MGWADCGTDSENRPIGYAFAGICDHPECAKKIDRGLAYACGGMHGDCGGVACEKYYCSTHLPHFLLDTETNDSLLSICTRCADRLLASGEFAKSSDGIIKRVAGPIN